MKLLVFAHTPPPFHGQSYMVKLMLGVLGGDQRRPSSPHRANERVAVKCFHVNARLSHSIEDVGAVGFGKLLRLLGYCAEAIWYRFRYGVRAFYYVPAPAKRAAIYRDWIVLALCRPFFPVLIFHWHASGLGRWINSEARPWERWVSKWLHGRVTLSIVLAQALADDAARLNPGRIAVVLNGIPDPCPAFDTQILPGRQARWSTRQARMAASAAGHETPAVYQVVFLGSCMREKGLFDTVEAVAVASAELHRRACGMTLRLVVAGEFVSEGERAEFTASAARLGVSVTSVGFVHGEAKFQLLADSDCFCFPTYYSAEALPTSVIEAMAFGLDIIASEWRAIPEMLPEGIETVPVKNPAAVAKALVRNATETRDRATAVRRHFLQAFTVERFAAEITGQLQSAAV